MSVCPRCGTQLSFVYHYGQWYCSRCRQYQTAQARPPPPPAQPDLDFEIEHSPSFSALVFDLKQGQSVVAEAGAMMYMHSAIDIQSHRRDRSILKSLKTSWLGGESYYINTFTALHGSGQLALVGPTMGDIKDIDVSRHGMILQGGAYLASTPYVYLDTKYQGLKGVFAEGEFFMLHAYGPGKLWVTSFGGIIEKKLQAGEFLTVDTGHLVAFPDTMQYSVRRIGTWSTTWKSGEGYVTDLIGPGKILMQTRELPSFVRTLEPYLPKQRYR